MKFLFELLEFKQMKTEFDETLIRIRYLKKSSRSFFKKRLDVLLQTPRRFDVNVLAF